ncbi:MAG: alpha/beta fold hydrolase [Caulobacteraceae bacterium]
MGGGDETTTWPRWRTEAGRAKYLAAYEAALKDWPVPYEELDVETGLGPTHVVASGPRDAPPLILLPSFAATALVWRPNVEAFSQTRRVFAIDVIGQPGKSAARRRIRGRGDYAGWLAETLDGLGVARAPLAGCSFGAFLAASQALATPQRVERLVLIGPVGVFSAMSWRVALQMRTAPWRRRLARLTGDRPAPKPSALHARAAPLHAEDAGWRRLMGAAMAESPKASVTRAPAFSRADLARIAAPTLLLIGEHERLYEPHATLARALERMPGLEAEIVPDADHIAAMAQPEWVNGRLAGFLE